MLLTQILEAIFFAAEAPVTPAELLQGLEQVEAGVYTIKDVENGITQLQARYDESSAIELRELGGAFQLLTRPAYGRYIKQAQLARENRKLSKPALETLAIIAYRQPLTRAELEYIRGVNSDYTVQKLLERQLIEPAGRAEIPGKPLLYRTSTYFMDYFGLKSLSDLPRLQELNPHEETPAEAFSNTASEA